MIIRVRGHHRSVYDQNTYVQIERALCQIVIFIINTRNACHDTRILRIRNSPLMLPDGNRYVQISSSILSRLPPPNNT